MKKAIVTYNQLAAGALLKFGKLDSVDMSVLIEQISKDVEFVNNDSNNYFVIRNNNVELDSKYFEGVPQEIIGGFLMRIQGDLVKQYFNNFEVMELVLRKIKLLNNKRCIVDNFGASQLRALYWLYHERCICGKGIEKDFTMELTKRGELYLFLIDNRKYVEQFLELLKANELSDLLFDAYLMSCDLNSNVEDIFRLDRYMEFCLTPYEQPLDLTEREYSYKKVKIPTK